nr:PAS domain S-box protein [Marinicella sp. W31]MDC2877081.1 PAS domain S-box protein [Marinicella sp. W31]
MLAVQAEARSILDNSPDAILTMDDEGTIRHWNRSAERLFGYSAKDAEGQPLSLILSPPRAEEESDLSGRLGAGERSLRTERLHRDGSLIPVSVSIGPVISDRGETTGATEIIRDIGDLIATHKELAAAKRRIETLYRSTPAMLHSTDPRGTLLSVSDRWLEITGYSRDEVIGRRLVEFLTPDSARISKTELLTALLSEGHCENVQCQMVTRSGPTLDVLLSAILERDAQGNPLRIISTIDDVTQRRRAENALKEERRRLQQIIDATRSGTWEWNIQTGELRINRQWAAIIGEDLRELDPARIDTLLERLHPDDLSEHEALLSAHVRGETDSYDYEARLRHKSGGWVWVAGRGRILTWTGNGKPEWMFGTLQDITRQKDAQNELRKSRTFLERTGHIAGVGGWEVDVVDQKIFWSEETCRIHGVEPGHSPTMEEAIAFYAPEARTTIEAAVERSIATGEPWDMELPLIRADGQQIWARAAGAAQFDSTGKLVRLIGAFQDVTERIQQRLELERLNERMAIATENGKIGIWDANLKEGKTHYSDIWCAIIGYRRDEISDSAGEWLRFIHPDDLERAKAADVKHIAGDAPFFEEEFRMRHKDGRWIWILDRGRVVERDEHGVPLRMIGTHTDITARKTQRKNVT